MKEIFSNKMFGIVVIGITLIYIGILLLTSNYYADGKTLNIIVGISTGIFVVGCFILLYFENKIGYYLCPNCNNKFVISYLKALIAMHFMSTRYLKCPRCQEKSWCRIYFK